MRAKRKRKHVNSKSKGIPPFTSHVSTLETVVHTISIITFSNTGQNPFSRTDGLTQEMSVLFVS